MKFFLIIFFLFHTTLFYSDDTIDEIIVTAELSDNSLYRLPISASVIDEEVKSSEFIFTESTVPLKCDNE